MNKIVSREEATGLELEIIREFDAPVEMVFEAWTDVNALRSWMGPTGRSCPNAEANPVVEGAYSFPMVAENGAVDTVVGHYTTIDPPYRLAFSWSWMQEDGTIGHPMHVTLHFEEIEGNRTRMKLLHINLATPEARTNHNSGWVGCFDCLDGYLKN
ncbi:MAG: SRPBCC domain-containing protein [Sneathiellales bacterium]|nr:SRPBCC domain-containing protein [Sneathiellales bacterium]